MKDPDGIKHSKIDIQELRKRVLDRNFSHVINKTKKELSEKQALLTFGPQMGGLDPAA